ncbi:MAG: arginine deiminase-related protein [Chitinophagales bacterium]
MSTQYTSNLMMIRPASFQFNFETAVSNAFQKSLDGLTTEEIKRKAVEEFDSYVEKLRECKINVTVIQDTATPSKPDAIFPNNWISMHKNGSIFLYPMCTENRRLEIRPEIIEELKDSFLVNSVNDLTASVKDNKFLEGTGSIIFDHIHKIAYACLSPRTDRDLFIDYCTKINYKPIYFFSKDEHDNLVYHTNVMLTIGDTFAVICLASIKDASEQNLVKESLEKTGHEIIDITFEQMNAFAGNMLQVQNTDGKTYLVMSETSYDSLNAEQIKQIEKHTTILSVKIPTIETIGGGSARCMLAEIYLKEK